MLSNVTPHTGDWIIMAIQLLVLHFQMSTDFLPSALRCADNTIALHYKYVFLFAGVGNCTHC